MDLQPLTKHHESVVKTWLDEFYQNHLSWWSSSLGLNWNEGFVEEHIKKHDLTIKAWHRLLSQTTKSDHFITTAQLGNQLLGIVHANTDIDKNTGLEIGEILWIHVRVENRREGIGQRLMDVAHEWFNAQKISGIALTVNHFNRAAQELYQKCGYHVSDLRMIHPL